LGIRRIRDPKGRQLAHFHREFDNDLKDWSC